MGKSVTKAAGAAQFSEADLAKLQRVADVLAYSPDLVDLLGGNVDATVSVSDNGGLIFEFELARQATD